MTIESVVSSIPSWVLFCLMVAIGILAAEAGAILAQRKTRKSKPEPEAPVGTAVAAILGLLAFMLGFTFSLTEARFSDRKELIIEEANAIGTCYLRTSLIPEKQKNEIRKLLLEYTNLMVETDNEDELEPAISRVEEIHLLIWQQTASLVQEDVDSELRSLFTASVNQVIDLFSARKTVGLIFRIPAIIWFSLFLLMVISMFAFGYQTGMFGLRRILMMPLLAAAFALVIALIADMDSTETSRFKVSHQPLKDVQEMMRKNIP